MLGTLLMLFMVGFVAVVVIGAVLLVLGVVLSIAFGLAQALVFTVLPVLLIGWLVLKLVRRDRVPRRQRISAADRQWLDS